MNKCDKCNKEFQSSYHLNRHKNKKIPCNNIEQYECKDCDKIFKYKSKLEEHSKTKNHLLIVNNITNNTILKDEELNQRLKQEYESKLNQELELKENEINKLKKENALLNKINKFISEEYNKYLNLESVKF